jgi:hypothetical protein
MRSLDPRLGAIKSCFNTLFMTPVAAYTRFPFYIFSQLLRCLVMLSLRADLEESSWTENSPWKKLDVILTLDRVINNFDQVATLAGLENSDCPEGNPFS